MSLNPIAVVAAHRPIRVVALDLDGTILEAGKDIRSDVLDLLGLLVDRGIRCVTATGRPIDFQLELLARYELSDCFQALVVDERELYFRRHATFTPDQEWNGRIRGRWQDRAPEAMQWVEQALHEATSRGMTASPLPAVQIAARGLATLRFDDPEPAETIRAWLSSRLVSGGSELACNRNTTNVQVYDAAAGKASVLTRLASTWKISPQEILAIGDSSNDHDMVDGSHGFRSATTANADGAVKSAVLAAGGYVAQAVSGAGVVEAVRALVPEASELDRKTGTHAYRAR